jgi:hypothetical protein
MGAGGTDVDARTPQTELGVAALCAAAVLLLMALLGACCACCGRRWRWLLRAHAAALVLRLVSALWAGGVLAVLGYANGYRGALVEQLRSTALRPERWPSYTSTLAGHAAFDALHSSGGGNSSLACAPCCVPSEACWVRGCACGGMVVDVCVARAHRSRVRQGPLLLSD